MSVNEQHEKCTCCVDESICLNKSWWSLNSDLNSAWTSFFSRLNQPTSTNYTEHTFLFICYAYFYCTSHWSGFQKNVLYKNRYYYCRQLHKAHSIKLICKEYAKPDIFDKYRSYYTMFCRASKSPDLAGDLPIFDIVMTISRFEMKISRFITRDSRLALANFDIAVGETTFSLTNVVKNRSPIWRKELSVIEKNKACLTPQEATIFIDTLRAPTCFEEPGKPLFRATRDHH